MRLSIIIAIVAFLWLGMILAIGMESIVKFQATTLTKPVAFEISRVVFSAFNKVQALLLVVIVLCGLLSSLKSIDKVFILVLAVVFLLQMIWLFPALSRNVDMILMGLQPPPSYKHSLYGGLEVLKAVLLLILGARLI